MSETFTTLPAAVYGPHIMPAALFAASAPPTPDHFQPEFPGEPLQPEAILNEEERAEFDRWQKGHIEDEDVAFERVQVLTAAYAQYREAYRRWRNLKEESRHVTWRWHWAQSMIAGVPSELLAPFVMAEPAVQALEETGDPLMALLFKVRDERDRQRQLGYTDAHDDEHVHGEIAAFACWYAMPLNQSGQEELLNTLIPPGWDIPSGTGDRKDELLKAITMLAAEYLRIERAEARA